MDRILEAAKLHSMTFMSADFSNLFPIFIYTVTAEQWMIAQKCVVTSASQHKYLTLMMLALQSKSQPTARATDIFSSTYRLRYKKIHLLQYNCSF